MGVVDIDVLLNRKENKVDLRKNSIEIFFVTFMLLNLWLPPAHAGGSEEHELFDFLESEQITREDIQKILGTPDRLEKKLGGWEYWHYDTISFKEHRINLQNFYFKFLVFKNGKFIPPEEFARRKSAFLRIVFFPITVLLMLPFGSYLVIPLAFFNLWGIVKYKTNIRLFFIYLILGCLFVYLGVLF